MANSAWVFLAPLCIGCSISAHFINDADMFFQKKNNEMWKSQQILQPLSENWKLYHCINRLHYHEYWLRSDKLHKIASIYKYLFHVLLFEIFVKKKTFCTFKSGLFMQKNVRQSCQTQMRTTHCSPFAFTFPHNHSTEQKSIIHRK